MSDRGRAALAAACLLVHAACGGQTPLRTRSPLLIVSNRGGPLRVYEEGEDGAARPIGDAGEGGEHSDTMPARLPDSSIVFVSDRDGNREIYLAMIDGRVRRLTQDPPASPADDTAPAPLGPDRIVFARTEPGAPPGAPRDLYALPLDGGAPIRLTRDPADDFEPWGSKDGRSVVFVSSRTGVARIYLLPDIRAENADASAICLSEGSPHAASPSGAAYSDGGPVFLPDGSIAFSRGAPDGVPQIYRMDGRGARVALRQITDPIVLPYGAMEPIVLDERTILLTAGPRSGRYAVYSVALGGFNLARVTRDRAPYSDYTRGLSNR